ncbi:aspartate aminotransferase family protein [Afifella pfennigii]|uniref:aspartate aminotransferase family protein n=1 Tax=Afifella pfennigii TaxID=209897 RepID=UPI00047E6BCD|nr:aspartate aminotransferase family protein [Afifella pfennigii]
MAPSHVFSRDTRKTLPVVAGGDGCWLVDAQGKRYLDASGGAAVSCLGHSCRPVLEAAKAQLDTIAYAHTGFFTSEPAESLAEALIARAPSALQRVYFVSGGSEAIEAAIKLARQCFLEIGQSERTEIISRWQSYHGNTLGALATGGNRWRRVQFEPLLAEAMHHISPCHYWRWGEAGESAEAYGERLAQELEARILQLGPGRVAAFVAEPVVGATMGAVPAVPGYFRRIREICDRYGVLLILDEVMCGSGRTGSFYAFEQEDVTPDIVCIAKGLGAGIQPIGATICSSSIYEAIASGSGFFQHGHTYMGHPTACATALAVLEEIDRHDLLANVRETGERLQQGLRRRFADNAFVGDIRGRGLFRGLELVANPETKAPFDPALGLAGRIKAAAMARGLACYPMGGTIDGRFGDHVLLAPPYIISAEEIDIVVERLGEALEAALADIGA